MAVLQRWDGLLFKHAFRVSSLSPNLLLSYLVYRKDEAKCLTVWHLLLTSVAASNAIQSSVMKNILEAAKNKKLHRYLKPQEAELDGLVTTLLEKTLESSNNSEEASLLKQILISSGPLLFLPVFPHSRSFYRIFLIAGQIRDLTGNHCIYFHFECPVSSRRESPSV